MALALLATILLTASQLSPASAADPAAGTPRETPAGSESLLDGPLADAWEGSLDDWTLKDGVLTGTTDGSVKVNRFITSKFPPAEDFELEVDVWVSPRGNSGIQYRSEVREDLGPNVMVGYQCDVVAANPKYNGMLYEERGRRILCHTGEKVVTDANGQGWVVKSSEPPQFAPETWHRYKVRVVGNHHQHWIDGQLTADHFDMDPKGRSLSGRIGVQVHVGPPMEIRYRNFFVKRLAPTAKPDDSVEIPDNAEKIVPQGGWKNAGKRDANHKLEKAELPGTRNVHRAGPIWLAGQPDAQGLAAAKKAGVTRVITLRSERELDFDDEALVKEAGLEFHAIRFGGHQQMTDQKIDRIRELLKTARHDAQILLHCASANRVGAVWIAHRVLDGRQAVENALLEGKQIGLLDPDLGTTAVEYVKQRKP
ncbi:secreted glycosyl hydrolase [Rhodopirellula islandica]|uniref:Secreted glycosyl hydrolase n=1 Tax=Rhodopirellula islandica TaxID=595434 RepID=A0A0J1BE32_RHOIS|nr:family 16 glycoside hydrolase [Rhodopirellula islandica]KLU04857.1 secreted glycosyl hydrolase [Rhodopirellula islandica]